VEGRGQLFDVYGHKEPFDSEQFTMKVSESSKSLFFSDTANVSRITQGVLWAADSIFRRCGSHRPGHYSSLALTGGLSLFLQL
jgi:hypothetical protein